MRKKVNNERRNMHHLAIHNIVEMRDWIRNWAKMCPVDPSDHGQGSNNSGGWEWGDKNMLFVLDGIKLVVVFTNLEIFLKAGQIFPWRVRRKNPMIRVISKV